MWDWLTNTFTGGALSSFLGDLFGGGASDAVSGAADNIDAGGGWNPATGSGDTGALSSLFTSGLSSPDISGIPSWSNAIDKYLSDHAQALTGDNIDAGGGQNFAVAGPQGEQGTLAKFLNNIGIASAAPNDGSIGKIDLSDPKVLAKIANLAGSGLSILNALGGGSQNVGKKTPSQMQAELASPFNQWQPQFQIAADQMANRKYVDRSPQALTSTQRTSKFAHGGKVDDDKPQFVSEGALSRAVRGPGGGQDDIVPARLAPGEWVGDADFVAAVGDGNTDRGIQKLDDLREKVRSEKRSAPSHSIPPKTKALSTYMKGA